MEKFNITTKEFSRIGDMTDAELLAFEERLLNSGDPPVVITNRLEYIRDLRESREAVRRLLGPQRH